MALRTLKSMSFWKAIHTELSPPDYELAHNSYSGGLNSVRIAFQKDMDLIDLSAVLFNK